jgi:hypothetical protein
MVAIGGIADIVQHWHEMARSRMTHLRHRRANFSVLQNTAAFGKSAILGEGF